MSQNLKAGIEIEANANRFVSETNRAGQALRKLETGTQQTGSKLQALDRSTKQAGTSVDRLGQTTQRTTQNLQQMGQKGQAAGQQLTQGMSNAAGASQRMSQSAQQATQATSRFNAGTIATGASIATMGAGLVSMEASFSNYTKAQQKVEKAEQGVQKTRDLLLTTNVSLQRAELKLSKMLEKGTATEAELAAARANVALYTQKRATATQELTVKEQDLNIAMMDQADTHKLMASSIATTVIGTVSMAAQMIQAKAATAGATTSMVANMKANLANSRMLKVLGIDLSAAKVQFQTASASIKGATFSMQGAQMGLKGLAAGFKGLWLSMGPIGILTILATSLYTAWETSQQFRDGIMYVIDEIQKFFEIIKKVILPLQWLDDGLKALGINVGENVDKWQEENAIIGETDKTMQDMTQTVADTDTQVQQLTDAVETDTAAMLESKVAVSELDTGMATMSSTIDSVAIPSIGRYTDAMREAGAATGEMKQNAVTSFREASASAAQWSENMERHVDDAELNLLHFANEHTRIMAQEGPAAAAAYADSMRTQVQDAVNTVQKGEGDMSLAISKLGVSFESLGIKVGTTSDEMATNFESGTSRINQSITSTQGAMITLMHKMDALSKKKYSVLNDLKNITDVSQMTAAQIAAVEAAYNRMKTNEFLLEKGLPPQGKFFASEEMGSVYVMGDGESALKADGSIDYEKLARIGKISAANLAKIKAQSKAYYGKQAGQYLQQLGLATESHSVDDKQDLATVRSVAQNTYSTGVQGKGGLYANQGQNIRHHGPGQERLKAREVLQSGWRIYTIEGDGFKQYPYPYLKNDRKAWERRKRTQEGIAIYHGGMNFSFHGPGDKTYEYFKRWSAVRSTVYANIDNMVTDAEKRQASRIALTAPRKTYGNITTHGSRKRGLIRNKAYSKVDMQSLIASGISIDVIAEYMQNFLEFGSDDHIQDFAAWRGGGNTGNVADFKAWQKAEKEKRDKELAEKLAAQEAKEKREREQQIYNSQLQSYNQDMALYNMIQRMFPGQAPSWKPEAPKSPQQIAFDTAAQKYRESYVPPPPPPKLAGTPERDEIIRRLKMRRFASSNPIESYTTEELRNILVRTIRYQNGGDQTVQRELAEIARIAGTATTGSSGVFETSYDVPTDRTGTKIITQEMIDYAQSEAGQNEYQRHLETLVSKGKWKSEYEGHDVYELRQVIEVHAK